MKIADAWQNYYTHSGKASDIVRYLGYTGLAVVWVLCPAATECAGSRRLASMPPILRAVAVILLLSLMCDLIQYLAGSYRWWRFSRSMEIKYEGDEQFDAYPSINLPGEIAFCAKIVLCIAGYAVLLTHLVRSLL